MRTINKNIINSIEKNFGKEIKVGGFNKDDIDKVNKIAEQLIENQDIFDINTNQTLTNRVK